MFRYEQSMSLEEVKEEFETLNRRIKDVLKKLGTEGENIDCDRDDLDEMFLRSEYIKIADKLDEVRRSIDYLSKPVIEQGHIRHNSQGRYELPSGRYLTSGSSCEILHQYSDREYWLYTQIEHNGEDYYATALGRNVSIDGKMVRVRG
ncbi:DUF5348 domain-containing protein [Anoxybacillus rupiensis]|uniref:DUF5348 domain-containing protein n=1 Tax=Anoxybacteroides rupiense TaxID=311460 RepID=A0ABD5IW64_9BACL|nr:DUF5348 domain-containing protein [Anoxybacillus rupiensis]